MNKDLETYIGHLKGVIPKEFCEKLISQNEEVEWGKHSYYNKADDGHQRDNADKEFDVNYGKQDSEEYSILMENTSKAFKTYLDNFSFPWFDSLIKMSSIRFNKYTEGTHMDPHCDHIQSLFEDGGVPVLTALGVLNDDYEGGDLILFEDTKIEMKQGDIIVFPSNFLYPHMVTPVTKGIRYSFVSWAW